MQQSVSLKKRLKSLSLGLFYALVALSISFVGGSFLYEAGRSLALARHPVPALHLESTLQPQRADEQPVSVQAVQATDREEVAVMPPGNFARGQVNILLLGTDERADENGPPRTDTMMVLNLDLLSRSAGLISLPRDLWVPIPGYDITTKINTAYAIGEKRNYPGGGPQLAKDTVSSFLGRPVDYHVSINFSGFVRFVDLIGGVDIHVPKTIHDERYPTADYGYETFHLDSGYQRLDGETALKYVRTRNTDDDYARAQRQQQVIQAVLDKILMADMVPTLVARAPQLYVAMRDSVGTDLPLTTAIDLANYIRQNPVEDVRRLVLDSQFGEETFTDEGAWVLLPDRSRIRPVLSDFFNPSSWVADGSAQPDAGLIATTDRTLSTASVVDQTQLRVEVLNGTGYPGIAAQVRDLLQEEGWQVVSIGDADRSDYRRTLLVNYNAGEQLVQQVGVDLQLAPNLPTLSGLSSSNRLDMRIVVGQDFLKDVLNIASP